MKCTCAILDLCLVPYIVYQTLHVPLAMQSKQSMSYQDFECHWLSNTWSNQHTTGVYKYVIISFPLDMAISNILLEFNFFVESVNQLWPLHIRLEHHLLVYCWEKDVHVSSRLNVLYHWYMALRTLYPSGDKELQSRRQERRIQKSRWQQLELLCYWLRAPFWHQLQILYYNIIMASILLGKHYHGCMWTQIRAIQETEGATYLFRECLAIHYLVIHLHMWLIGLGPQTPALSQTASILLWQCLVWDPLHSEKQL